MSQFRGKERDPYAEVGAAMRLSVETAVATAEGRELPRAARALFAALHATASRSKLWDTVYLAQLVDLASIPGDTDGKITAHWLREWTRRGALIWRPSTKPGEPSWIGLPGSLAQQLPLVAAIRGDTKNTEGGTLRASRPALSVPPSEKYRERPSGHLYIETECMGCVARGDLQPRPCIDDGRRILCDQCRQAA